jgi:acyl-CoA thioesterase
MTAVDAGSMFDRDTAVEPVGDGRFTGHVSPRWSGLAGNPLGGYVLMIALRALRQVMPLPDPLVVSAFFLEPVGPGPVEVRTNVLRAGRRTATGEVFLDQGGREAIRATVTFADIAAFTGPTRQLADPPALPPPDEAIDLYADVPPPPPLTVAGQLAFRVARTPGWRTGTLSGEPAAEFWLRLADGEHDDPLILPFLVDAAPPAVLELGAAGTTTLQLTVHIHRRPAPGWLACRARTRFLTNGLHEEDFEVWDGAGNLIAQSRQLALFRSRPAPPDPGHPQ